jgi:hypothetical protein
MRARTSPFLDLVADVGADFGNAVIAQFGADDRFLPGGDVAAGGEGQRPVEQLRG